MQIFMLMLAALMPISGYAQATQVGTPFEIIRGDTPIEVIKKAEPVWEGVTPTAIDGDTLQLGNELLRIAFIDAPEEDPDKWVETPPYAGEAQAKLAELVSGVITCWQTDRDLYGRIVALCESKDVADLGEAMVQAGLAWDYERYSLGRYGSAQWQAQWDSLFEEDKEVIWKAKCAVPPWRWRTGIRDCNDTTKCPDCYKRPQVSLSENASGRQNNDRKSGGT